MPLFPTSQSRYMLTQTKHFIINFTFIEWLMPCGDKVDSQSPVFNPGWGNYARGTLTKLYSFGEDGSNLVGARKGLGFKVSLEWLSLPHCEHSLAFMYFGRTKRWGKPAKIWTCASGNLLVGQLLQMCEKLQRNGRYLKFGSWATNSLKKACMLLFLLALKRGGMMFKMPQRITIIQSNPALGEGRDGRWNSVERDILSPRNLCFTVRKTIFKILLRIS